MHAPALPEREALRNVMAEFADAIAESEQPLTDASVGLRVLTLLEAASESAENGGAKIAVHFEGSGMIKGQRCLVTGGAAPSARPSWTSSSRPGRAR